MSGAGHGALATIGKGELTAGRQGFRGDASLPMDPVSRRAGREIARDDAGRIVTRGWRDAVAVGCFLCGGHRQCYRQGKLRGQMAPWITGRPVENGRGPFDSNGSRPPFAKDTKDGAPGPRGRSYYVANRLTMQYSGSGPGS